MHQSVCICALMPCVEVRSKLVVLMHFREERKTTNSGRVAARCLVGSRVLVRGRPDEPQPSVVGMERPLLLFPHEGAEVLGPQHVAGGPVTLIVPDGNWRQASRMRQRVEGLADAVCVTLPRGAPSRYRLRAEAHEEGLATAEAIARAYGILEGPDVQRAIEAAFSAMVERTLWVRGRVLTEEVTGGIPEGVVRHDPGSGRPAPLG